MNPEARGILYALLTFFCFGITNFLLGYISEKASDPQTANLIAPILVWLGMGLLAVLFLLFMPLSGGRALKGFVSGRDTLLTILAGVILALSMMSLKIGFMTDPSAKGPITAVASANSIIVALLAWLLLKETLSSLQWIGILVTLAGIVVMALSGGGHQAIRGVIFGVITLLGFGITNTILKIVGHHGMNSITAALVIWLTAGGCGLAGLVALHFHQSGIWGLTPAPLRMVSIAAGFFLGAGMWSIKRGVTVGRAGPVAAVAGSNALLVSLLDYMVFGNGIGIQKLVGMVAAIAGIMILAMFANRFRG